MGRGTGLELPVAPENVSGGGSLRSSSPSPHSTDGKTGSQHVVLYNPCHRWKRTAEKWKQLYEPSLLSIYYVLFCTKNSTCMISFNLQKNPSWEVLFLIFTLLMGQCGFETVTFRGSLNLNPHHPMPVFIPNHHVLTPF